MRANSRRISQRHIDILHTFSLDAEHVIRTRRSINHETRIFYPTRTLFYGPFLCHYANEIHARFPMQTLPLNKSSTPPSVFKRPISRRISSLYTSYSTCQSPSRRFYSDDLPIFTYSLTLWPSLRLICARRDNFEFGLQRVRHLGEL